jgi:hypothetical protein
MAAYKGRVELTEVDEASHTVRMTGEGREKGGGTAKALMTSRLTALESRRTEIVAEASVDLTGKIMKVGRGMIQGVSHQLFQQFVKRIRSNLEVAAEQAQAAGGHSGVAATGTAPPTARPDDDAIAVVPLLLKTVWAGIVSLLRRLFGRT